MTTVPKLTTAAACRVAGIHRDRFNEHVAAGAFPCAPETVPGRTRLFDPDDMISLRLFRELTDDGFDARKAGLIACAVATAARQHPSASVIAYVETYAGSPSAFPAEGVPPFSEWDDPATWDHGVFRGSDPRKVTFFRVSKLRQLIAHWTEQERSIIGEND